MPQVASTFFMRVSSSLTFAWNGASNVSICVPGSGRTSHAKLVHFTCGDDSLTGKFAWVEITGADVYTLTGKLVE